LGEAEERRVGPRACARQREPLYADGSGGHHPLSPVRRSAHERARCILSSVGRTEWASSSSAGAGGCGQCHPACVPSQVHRTVGSIAGAMCNFCIKPLPKPPPLDSAPPAMCHRNLPGHQRAPSAGGHSAGAVVGPGSPTPIPASTGTAAVGPLSPAPSPIAWPASRPGPHEPLPTGPLQGLSWWVVSGRPPFWHMVPAPSPAPAATITRSGVVLRELAMSSNAPTPRG